MTMLLKLTFDFFFGYVHFFEFFLKVLRVENFHAHALGFLLLVGINLFKYRIKTLSKWFILKHF